MAVALEEAAGVSFYLLLSMPMKMTMVVGHERSSLLGVLPGHGCSMLRRERDHRHPTARNLALPMTENSVKELRICEVEWLGPATNVQVSR